MTAGTYGFGKKQIQFNTLADLAGHNVGAAGGGVISARILTGQGQGHFNVVAFDNGQQVLDALNAGTVDAAIYVGGSPLPNLVNLKADDYKLLSIPESISNNLLGSGPYRPAIINYQNLKSGPIKTLAPQALLITRKYSLPKMIAPQAEFRKCFYEHLDELKETPGKHPKWQMVDPSDHGVWDWYDLPTAVAVKK